MLPFHQYDSGVSQGSQLDQKAGAAQNFVLVPLYEEIQITGVAAATTSFTAFLPTNATGTPTWQLAAVSARFGTASSSGTLQVEVAGATVAVGSGTNQLTGTISLAGTANTTLNGTLITTPTVFGAGSAVNVILAGTLTSLANCNVTLTLQRVS